MKMGNQLTVGLVVNSLREVFATLYWDALVDLCAARNINLIVYPVNMLGAEYDYIYQYNLIFEFIHKNHVDGLIVLSNSMISETVDDPTGFFTHLTNIPIISIGKEFPFSISDLFVDNYSGIEEAMCHLIEVHGCRRLAFFKGNLGHQDTYDRYDAYLKVLEKYQIPFDERLVLQSAFAASMGAVSTRELIDRNVPFDAIIASNDAMAIGVVGALMQNNILVPEDVKVVGFDNIKQIQYEGSPLSTVRQPVLEIAEMALDRIQAFLKGEPVPKSTVLPTRFVRRASCGCMETLQPHYTHENIRKELKKIVNDYHVENFLVTGVHRLSSAFNIEQLASAIEQEFPQININTFFLVLYQGDEVEDSSSGLGYLPKRAQLILAYVDGKKQHFKEADMIFATKNLLPQGLPWGKKQYSMTIEPLFFNEERYGYIYYEVGTRVKAVFEIIRRQISTALRVMTLLEHLKETQEELAQSMKMSSLNSLVAGVAHEINSPLGVSISAASLLEEQTNDIIRKLSENTLSKGKFVNYLEQTKETCKVLLDNLGRGAHLVNSFKDIAADQTVEEIRALDLTSYVGQVLLGFRTHIKRQGIVLELVFPENITLRTYPGILSQVITNLINNALTHAFTDQVHKKLTISITQEKQQVYLKISDNGIGILPEHLSKIYDPFFTTKRGAGGTGLGLNIVYNLVTQKLGGQISCKSVVNEGTEFLVRLPKEMIKE